MFIKFACHFEAVGAGFFALTSNHEQAVRSLSLQALWNQLTGFQCETFVSERNLTLHR